MITKTIDVIITEDEINSPEPIEIKIRVYAEDDHDNPEVTYTIKYPKVDIKLSSEHS